MNGLHHEQLALDTLRCLPVLGEFQSPIIPAFFNKTDCKALFQATSAPDRLRDTSLPVLGALGDRYEFIGNNLASFQHFASGYLWGKDPGKNWAETTVLELVNSVVKYEPQRFGEQVPGAPIPTPMLDSVNKQPGAKLADFRFPSAIEMALHFEKLAHSYWISRDYANWRLCVGYILHFLHDMFVPHHVWGTIFLGHVSWENQIQDHWLQHVSSIKLVDKDGSLYRTQLMRAVSNNLPKVQNIQGLMQHAIDYTKGTFGQPQDLSECSLIGALDTCLRAVAASVVALKICAN